MKLLEQYRAACEVRRLAKRTIQTYCRWVEEFLRFHHDRTGHWIHPREMGEKEVEAFLTHLAVNRRLAESTQNQALGTSVFLEPRAGTQTSGDSGPAGTAKAASPGRSVAGGSCETAAGGLPRAV